MLEVIPDDSDGNGEPVLLIALAPGTNLQAVLDEGTEIFCGFICWLFTLRDSRSLVSLTGKFARLASTN